MRHPTHPKPVADLAEIIRRRQESLRDHSRPAAAAPKQRLAVRFMDVVDDYMPEIFMFLALGFVALVVARIALLIVAVVAV